MNGSSATIQGYLERESLYLKNFKKSWMVLQGNMLYAFKNQYDNTTPIETIDLSIYDKIKKSFFNKSQFQIISSNRKSLRAFNAPSVEEMNKWVQYIQQVQKPISIYPSIPFQENKDDEKQLISSSKAHFVQISSSDNIYKAMQQHLKKLRIDKINLVTPSEIKDSFHDDRYNSYITPITSDPILIIKLNTAFNEWNSTKHNSFIKDIATTLNIKPSQLLPVCVTAGSVVMSMIICNMMEEKFSDIETKCVSLAKNNTLPKKWKIDSSELKICASKQLIKHKKHKQTAHINNNNVSLSAAEKWFVDQAQSLRDSIMISLQQCPNEYEISAIFVLDNDKCLTQFIKQPSYQNSKILFHGTKLDYLGSIFKSGFDDKFIGSSTDPGWFGKGHYFSSYPQYSIKYCEPNVFDQYTLIVSYVNLGKTYQIYDNKSYYGKSLKNGYQSHYVKVDSTGHPIPKQHIYAVDDDIYDEYVVYTGKRVLPRFCVTFTKKSSVVVWRDAKIGNAENSGILDKLRKSYVIYGAATNGDALKVIAKKKSNNKVYVITNGADNSEQFIKTIRNTQHVNHSILVFTGSMDYQKVYNKYNDINVTTSTENVYEFVKKRLES